MHNGFNLNNFWRKCKDMFYAILKQYGLAYTIKKDGKIFGHFTRDGYYFPPAPSNLNDKDVLEQEILDRRNGKSDKYEVDCL